MASRDPAANASERVPTMWDGGDWAGLVRLLRNNAPEEFVATLRTKPPGRALDIACGTGSSIIPLARLGFDTTGLDYSRPMLDSARAEAEKAGVTVTLDDGVAENMPFPDATFDVAIAMFGFSFFSAPQEAVRETARVLKPGGELAMANWTPGCFTAGMNGVMAPHLPPLPAGGGPSGWGDPVRVREFLRDEFDEIETELVRINWTVDLSPAETARAFIQRAGPMQAVMGMMNDEQRAGFTADFEQYWRDHNISTDAGVTIITNEYLRTSAVRKSGG